MKDFKLFKETEHMLQWLSDNPYEDICSKIESMLQKQIPGTKLLSIQVTQKPQWLTGGREQKDDPDHIILVRTGVAFELNLVVTEPSGETHHLVGTYTWVGINLDDPDNCKQRIWFDINTTLKTHGSEGELISRMYFDD